MTMQYLNTKDLSERLRCSERTIFRRMNRNFNPLPRPVIKVHGATNLWLYEEIIEWEEKEILRTRTSQCVH